MISSLNSYCEWRDFGQTEWEEDSQLWVPMETHLSFYHALSCWREGKWSGGWFQDYVSCLFFIAVFLENKLSASSAPFLYSTQRIPRWHIHAWGMALTHPLNPAYHLDNVSCSLSFPEVSIKYLYDPSAPPFTTNILTALLRDHTFISEELSREQNTQVCVGALCQSWTLSQVFWILSLHLPLKRLFLYLCSLFLRKVSLW